MSRISVALIVFLLVGCTGMPAQKIKVPLVALVPDACNSLLPDIRYTMHRGWVSAIKHPDRPIIVYQGRNSILPNGNFLIPYDYICIFNTATKVAEFSKTKRPVLVLEKPHTTFGQPNFKKGKYLIAGNTKNGWLYADYRNTAIPGGGSKGWGMPSDNSAINFLKGGLIGLAISGDKPRLAYRSDTKETCAKPGAVWLCKDLPARIEFLELIPVQ